MEYNKSMKKRNQQRPNANQLFELPKIKKRKFFRTIMLLSFFVGLNFVIDKINHKDPLPYKDDQELPKQNTPEENNLLEKLEMQIALDAYNHLLSSLYQKSEKLGVDLSSDYLIKLVSYDNMTDTIEVVLQNEKNTAILKFSARNLDKVEIDENMKMSDQISELAILLNSPLLQAPKIISFDPNLNKTLNNAVTSGIKNYANSMVQISYGDYRNEIMDDSLFAGRDYLFFNVYGKGIKDGTEYNVVTIISMSRDDFEMLEQPNLIEYYLSNNQDSRFNINVFYQESQKVFDKLNQEKINQSLFEK